MVSVDSVISGGTTVGIIIILTVFFGGLLYVGLYWYMKKKRFQTKVEWFDVDGITGGTDSGGIYIDKRTGRKMFYLRYAAVGLNPNNVPWRLIDGTKKVFLLRYGLKNFRFIDMNIGSNRTFKASVGEEDVNWAVVDYQRQKQTFMDSKLFQLLPYIALTFTAVIILIMIIFVLRKFDVLLAVSQTLQNTATILANAASGTTVIP